MTCEAQATAKAYTLTGLNLVDTSSVVEDMVTDLQREMTLCMLGPYADLYLSLYRNGQSLSCWGTTEQRSYQELSAMSQQRQTLVYPQGQEEQREIIRALVLSTFFTHEPEQEDAIEPQIPAGATPLVTVREINRALRAHIEHIGGRVCCLNQQRDEVMQVFHAKQPRGESIKVAGSNGYWITPGAVWVEPIQ